MDTWLLSLPQCKYQESSEFCWFPRHKHFSGEQHSSILMFPKMLSIQECLVVEKRMSILTSTWNHYAEVIVPWQISETSRSFRHISSLSKKINKCIENINLEASSKQFRNWINKETKRNDTSLQSGHIAHTFTFSSLSLKRSINFGLAWIITEEQDWSENRF